LSHMQEPHDVARAGDRCTSPAALGGGDGKIQITRARLPNGEVKLLCPICDAVFDDGKEAELLEHAAAEHGQAWASMEAGVWGESEHLDKLHQAPSEHWHDRREEARRRLHIISLGSFCGMKFSIQRLGLGDAHLPFDWIRSTADGVRHFVAEGFRGFFSIASVHQVTGSHMIVHRSERHSFWHDNVSELEVREKLRRRVARFLQMSEDSTDLLFLRSVTSTDELRDVEDLYAVLVRRFDRAARARRVLLAVVIDGQPEFRGPIAHAGLPGVLFLLQPTDVEASSPAGSGYSRAVTAAVNAALSTPEGTAVEDGFGLANGSAPAVPSAAALLTGKAATVVHFDGALFSGYGDLRCFEDSGAEHRDLSPVRDFGF